jgi:hypothetical protein
MDVGHLVELSRIKGVLAGKDAKSQTLWKKIFIQIFTSNQSVVELQFEDCPLAGTIKSLRLTHGGFFYLGPFDSDSSILLP